MKTRYQPNIIIEKYHPIIGIFGSSTANDKLFSFSQEIGKTIASIGFTLAHGGYTGIMNGVSKGASKINDSKIIGITTDEITKVNPSNYLTEEFREYSLMSRLDLMLAISDIYLFLPGSTGTLTELALVWDKQKLGLLPLRPILLFDESWEKVFKVMFKEKNPDVPLSTWKKDKEVEELTYLIKNLNEMEIFLKNSDSI